MKKLTILAMLFLFVGILIAEDVWVNGYIKKDGTYVSGYYRSKPTKSTTTTFDNSTYKSTTVKSYIKKDGTYVDSYKRSKKDNTTLNNWSTKGNTNPYTGKKGTKKTKEYWWE